MARHSWRTHVEMIHRITSPAQTRPGPPAASQLVVSFWKMRANARADPPADGKYPRDEIVVEHMAQHDWVLWPESAAPAPAAAGERPTDEIDANVESTAT